MITGNEYHDAVLLFGSVLIVIGMALSAYAANQYSKMMRLSRQVLSSLQLDGRQLASMTRVEHSREQVLLLLSNISVMLSAFEKENSAGIDANKDRIALLEHQLAHKLKFIPDPNKNTITFTAKCDHHEHYFMSIYKHGDQDNVMNTGIMFSVHKPLNGDTHVCVYCEDRMIFKFVTKLPFDDYLKNPHFVSKL